MAMITVNGVALPDPSEMTQGFYTVSNSDAGRDMSPSATMYVGKICDKVKYDLKWNGTDPETTSRILRAFLPETVQVTIWNAVAGENQTKTYYRGDISAAFKIWTVNNKRFSSISFSIVEV